MFNLSEYRKRFAYLPDFLPWAGLVGTGIILNKDGSFQRTAGFRGPDLESSVTAELMAVAARLNSAFRRLGSGWALFVEAQRFASNAYPNSRFSDPAAALLDAERKADFESDGVHFDSLYRLTLVYLPAEDIAARSESWLFDRSAPIAFSGQEHLNDFRDKSERLLKLFEGFMPECQWLDDVETLTYLHSTVSTHRHKVAVPETPMHLDVLLADQPLSGGVAPQLGNAHLRILTLTGFPASTVPGILDDLNRLSFPYRWTTRAVFVDKSDAVSQLNKIRRHWFAKRKSIGAILKEVMTNEASALVDNDANNKAADVDEALQELGADACGIAYVTATVVVWDLDARTADEKRRLVEKVIQGRDFTCILEGLNAVDAWLGTLPGHVYANLRQPPISTLNLAHTIPASAVWAGPERDEHLQSPPLLIAKTDGSTPFRLSLHIGDVGHCLVVGPTGAGKSVLLALTALQFRRYHDAQVFAFDYGRSMRVACLCMQGDWYDLGHMGDKPTVRLQPLALCADVSERAWASDWILAILSREGLAITPEVRELIWSALSSLASAPTEERTLTGLSILLQARDLKQALAPYCLGGSFGHLLDFDSETLGVNPVQVFETDGLLGSPAAAAVLAYLFHRIDASLDGRPTLILIDEGWLALDDDAFCGQLREWLKTLRKKNASVIFATQSLADIAHSPLAPVLNESCPTRIFLANARAMEPQIEELYRRFGLNDRQIHLIGSATPKQDYYLQSAAGNRLFELGLSAIGLALCATSSKLDQASVDAVLTTSGQASFLSAWLQHLGLDWAVDLIPSLKNLEILP